MPRRHDIDALRVFAFALLIVYHISGVYQAGSDFHVVSSYQYEWIDYARIVANRWRMPLLFVVSGIAMGFFLRGRGVLPVAGQRSWRLLLPLAFGMLFVVPVQAYCEARANGAIAPGFGDFMWRYLQLRPWPEGGWTGAEHGVTWNHLWYLAYLWVYTCGLLVLVPLLETGPGRRLQDWVSRRKGVLLVLVPSAWFFAVLTWLAPRFPDTHALAGDWALHAEYVPVFLAGYVVARRDAFWQELVRLRRTTLGLAIAAIGIELLLKAAGQYLPEGRVPAALASWPWHDIEHAARALYTTTALMAVFGWARTWLDRPFRWLPYATEAVYPWYILHQSLIVPIAYVLVPLHLGVAIESSLVVLGTVLGCLLLHEFVIRRSALLRPLFGLKRQRDRYASSTSPSRWTTTSWIESPPR